jgi:hypothetical protein
LVGDGKDFFDSGDALLDLAQSGLTQGSDALASGLFRDFQIIAPLKDDALHGVAHGHDLMNPNAPAVAAAIAQFAAHRAKRVPALVERAVFEARSPQRRRSANAVRASAASTLSSSSPAAWLSS